MKKKLVKKENDDFPRKMNRKDDNPIDTILYDIADLLSPFFKKLNFTPNMFTTLSFLTGLLSAYYYYLKKYNFTAIFYILSYWFDTIDGHFARKYNMQTRFGDYYDHVTDVLVNVMFLFLFYKNQDMPFIYKKYFFIFAIIITRWTSYHFNCVEKKNHPDPRFIKSDTLNFMCRGMCNDNLNLTSFFNAGTLIMYITIYILLHKNFNNI